MKEQKEQVREVESPLGRNAGVGEGIRAVGFRDETGQRRLDTSTQCGLLQQVEQNVEAAGVAADGGVQRSAETPGT